MASACAIATAGLLLSACATSMSGYVVKPDGSRMQSPDIIVYSDPWTDSVRVRKDGTFKIGRNVAERNKYTLIAEDVEGNQGFVRGFQPEKGENKNIVIRMAREVDGREAVIEGGPSQLQSSGPGEKIFKSSQ